MSNLRIINSLFKAFCLYDERKTSKHDKGGNGELSVLVVSWYSKFRIRNRFIKNIELTFTI